MSYLKHFILITIFFISVKASSTIPTLKKYDKVKSETGKVIFESKDFTNGDNMYFKVKANGDCYGKDLNYEYYDTDNEITELSSTRLYVTSHSSSSSSVQGRVTSLTRYFTIKKKSDEFKGLNGEYLLLYFKCSITVEFENTETDGAKKIAIIVVVVFVVFLVVMAVIIGVCCYCIRKRARMRRAYISQPNMMYGVPPPIYPQQGNMVMMYGGQQVIVQPNGIPYNNPNVPYSNLPYNTPSGLAANNNLIPQQNYNMVPQSSAERGYNPNNINEKGMK